MTRSEIDRIARKAGIKNDCDGIWCNADQLVRFANLVAEAAAKAEREECATACDKIERGKWETVMYGGAMKAIGARDCAEAIRARAKATQA